MLMQLNDIDPLQLIESLQEGVVVHDAKTKVIYANPKALEILRLSEEQALGLDALDPMWRFVDTNYNVMPYRDFPVSRVIAEKSALSNLELGVCDSSSDKITWVICNAFPQLNAAGEIEKVVVGFLDISSRKTDISFDAIVANSNDVILVTEAQPIDGDGPRIAYVNKAFCELTGYSASEVIGKTPRILQGDDTSQETRDNIRKALEEKKAVRETILNYSKAGVPYWLDMNIFPLENAFGEVTYFAAVERDITHQVNKEAKLQDLATKDPLTGLLNRRGFFDLAKKQLSNHANGYSSTIALIDVDFFKNVNDSFGHECGDNALVYLAAQINSLFRESDLFCRYGGEEFVVFLPGANSSIGKKKLEEFREKIASAIIELGGGKSTQLTVSIGMTELYKDANSIEMALNQADKALYIAKHLGRNKCIVANAAIGN